MFHIVVPAWGDRCVRIAAQYVVPSVRAALRDYPANLIVYTDQPSAFSGVEFRAVGRPGDSPQDALQGTLRNLHAWTIAESPPGSIAVLLNADIVVSCEFFQFIRESIYGGGYRTVVGTALRTVIKDEPVPIGACARDLLAWAWRNKHSIAEECVWGRGRAGFQNTVILENGEDVVLHSVHLHPFAIFNDGRQLRFKGTIDDDLLGNYGDDEIRYIRAGEVGFAELSPSSFKPDQYNITPHTISVDSVVKFGMNSKWREDHLRNFRQPIRIRGSHTIDERSIRLIADAIESRSPHG